MVNLFDGIGNCVAWVGVPLRGRMDGHRQLLSVMLSVAEAPGGTCLISIARPCQPITQVWLKEKKGRLAEGRRGASRAAIYVHHSLVDAPRWN